MMIKMSVNSVKLLIIALSQVNNLLAVSWHQLPTKRTINSSMVIVSLSAEAGLGEELVSKLVYKLYKLIAPNKKGIQFVYDDD
jgi:nucleoside permease NupC